MTMMLFMKKKHFCVKLPRSSDGCNAKLMREWHGYKRRPTQRLNERGGAMFDNVSPVELVWNLFGGFTTVIIIFNVADVLSDRLLMKIRKITDLKLQAAKDSLRNEVILLLMEM